ncbi:MAG: hypothetical protein QM768_12240 [Agriterribacter sp.]
MKQRKNKFNYSKSFRMIYWGCSFDSLTELKFAISIQDEWEFLRERITIYYHHGSLQPTNQITEGVRRYTPDFLIRNKQTGLALLVEIKPRAAENDPQLAIRRRVAENYIQWKGYDWQFKVIYDDEVILSEAMLEIFEDCCRLKSQSALRMWFRQLNHRYHASAPNFFAKVPSEADVRFIMFGERSQKRSNDFVNRN